jgi:IS30 family transposase
MGKQYRELDLDERIEFSRLHEAGGAPGEIARIMGRHPSTIGREHGEDATLEVAMRAAVILDHTTSGSLMSAIERKRTSPRTLGTAFARC